MLRTSWFLDPYHEGGKREKDSVGEHLQWRVQGERTGVAFFANTSLQNKASEYNLTMFSNQTSLTYLETAVGRTTKTFE
jgi:hypothetical protein